MIENGDKIFLDSDWDDEEIDSYYGDGDLGMDGIWVDWTSFDLYEDNGYHFGEFWWDMFHYDLPDSTFTAEIEFSNSTLGNHTLSWDYSIHGDGGQYENWVYYTVPKDLNGVYNITMKFYLDGELFYSEWIEENEEIIGSEALVAWHDLDFYGNGDCTNYLIPEWEIYTSVEGLLEVEVLLVNSTLGNTSYTVEYYVAGQSISTAFDDYAFHPQINIDVDGNYDVYYNIYYNQELIFSDDYGNDCFTSSAPSYNDWEVVIEEYYVYPGSYTDLYSSKLQEKQPSLLVEFDLDDTYFASPTMVDFEVIFWYYNEPAGNYIMTDVVDFQYWHNIGEPYWNAGEYYGELISPMYAGDYLIEVSLTFTNDTTVDTVFYEVYTWYTMGNTPESWLDAEVYLDAEDWELTSNPDALYYEYYYEDYAWDTYIPADLRFVVDIYREDVNGLWEIYDTFVYEQFAMEYHWFWDYYFFEDSGMYYVDANLYINGELAASAEHYGFFEAYNFNDYFELYEWSSISVYTWWDLTSFHFEWYYEGLAVSDPIEYTVDLYLEYTDYLTGYTYIVYQDKITHTLCWLTAISRLGGLFGVRIVCLGGGFGNARCPRLL